MGLLGELFSFEGRLSRIAFWRRGLMLSLLLVVVWVGMMFATLASPLGPLVAVLMAPILVASVSATIRRLHDRGRSLWWLLAVSGGVGACFGIATLLAELGGATRWPALPLIGLGLALLGWTNLEVNFLRGDVGPNRFGEPSTRRPPRRPRMAA